MAKQSLRRAIRTLCVVVCCTAAVDATATSSMVQVVLAEDHGVMFCHGCEDPWREGSFVPALTSAFNPSGYFTTAELVYGVPNRGERPLFNSNEVRGRIVMLDRGKVAFARKVQHAQQAGAIGVIIVDSIGCDPDKDQCFEDQLNLVAQQTQDISPSKALTTVFQDDLHIAWRGVEIPSILISAADGDRMRQFMRLDEFELDGEIHYINEI